LIRIGPDWDVELAAAFERRGNQVNPRARMHSPGGYNLSLEAEPPLANRKKPNSFLFADHPDITRAVSVIGIVSHAQTCRD